MTSWQALLITSVITYAVSILLQKKILSAKNSDSIAYCISFQIFTGIVLGLYALIKGFQKPNFLPVLPNMIFPVVLYGAGNLFVFQALRRIEASEFTIIFSTRVFFTIVAAIVFLKETITGIQLVGTFLLIFSIILVSWKSKKLSFHSGHLFGLLAAVCYGSEFANDAYIITKIDVSWYFSVVFLLQGVAVLFLYPKSLQKVKPLFQRKTIVPFALFIALYAIQAVTIFNAYKVGRNAAQIASLNQTTTIVTVILAILFLGERDYLFKKVVGVIVSFIGVLLIL